MQENQTERVLGLLFTFIDTFKQIVVKANGQPELLEISTHYCGNIQLLDNNKIKKRKRESIQNTPYDTISITFPYIIQDIDLNIKTVNDDIINTFNLQKKVIMNYFSVQSKATVSEFCNCEENKVLIKETLSKILVERSEEIYTTIFLTLNLTEEDKQFPYLLLLQAIKVQSSLKGYIFFESTTTTAPNNTNALSKEKERYRTSTISCFPSKPNISSCVIEGCLEFQVEKEEETVDWRAKESNSFPLEIKTIICRNGIPFSSDDLILKEFIAKDRKCEITMVDSSNSEKVHSVKEVKWRSKENKERLFDLLFDECSTFYKELGICFKAMTSNFVNSTVSTSATTVNDKLTSITLYININYTDNNNSKIPKCLIGTLVKDLIKRAKEIDAKAFLSKEEKRRDLLQSYYIPCVSHSIQQIIQCSSNPKFINDCLKLLSINQKEEISSRIQTLMVCKLSKKR
ncbi:hypothetical protein ABK040_016279 [Willaertia magna]